MSAAGHFSGGGLQVWPGETLRIAIDVPEGSVLRFATTREGAADADEPPTTYRIRQDGTQVFEHVVSATSDEVSALDYGFRAIEQ